jgi:ABC-2 type transport system ATP-binding protein
MNAAAPALALEGVSKRFGAALALDEVSLSLAAGGFLGLLGRNGAGKTTAISIATGLLPATTGRAVVLGLDVERHPLEVKRRIGVMPQQEGLLDLLTGPQYLRFAGGLYGLERREAERRGGELLEVLELVAAPGALVRDYSFGMRKKLALAAALLHRPELVFLDEPFEGLDPLAVRTVRDLLALLRARGVTLLMSSHGLDVVERLCEEVAILDRGRLVAHGTLAELRRHHGEFASLEDLFVRLHGGARAGELSWL